MKLLSVLNLGSPINSHSWTSATRWWEDLSIDMRERACTSAQLHLAEITKLERQPNEDGSVNVSMGFDGSWKCRGWTSNEGFASAVAEDTAQVVDVHHMVNNCRECNKYKSELEEGKIDQLSYLGKVVAHDKSGTCRLNHMGSPQSMESTGVIEMYRRSCDDKILRYIPFIGDGDSSAYTRVCQQRPYGPDVDIPKDECHVHVVRRMGRALRKLNTDLKKGAAKNDHGDKVKSKGLTNAVIQTIINFYGWGIRNNKGDAIAMSCAVWAILHHYKEHADHAFCPVGHTSWCSFQKDVANGTSLHVPIKNPIPTEAAECLTSLFKKLGSADFLKGCERVATQNRNESFNSLVWTMARKEVHNSSSETALAINLAVGIYNDGFFMTMKSLFGMAKIPVNEEMMTFWRSIDEERIRYGNYHSSEKEKINRKQRRKNKHARISAFQHKEGIEYKSSFFYKNECKDNAPQIKSKDKTTKKHATGCASCGLSTHKRSSHRLCPNNKKVKVLV